jgi:hypothetical protein
MATVLTKSQAAPGELTEIPSSRLWRLTVEQYHEMLRAGILSEDDSVELIEGVLVQKMGKNPPHIIALTKLRDLLLRLDLIGWTLMLQDPIGLDDSEPEPDATLVRGIVDDYASGLPAPDDIGLVVEVSDASLSGDRGYKKHLYAKNGIVQYWIVNLVAGQVEVHTEPITASADADYKNRTLYFAGDVVPLILDGSTLGAIPVAAILP